MNPGQRLLFKEQSDLDLYCLQYWPSYNESRREYNSTWISMKYDTQLDETCVNVFTTTSIWRGV